MGCENTECVKLAQGVVHLHNIWTPFNVLHAWNNVARCWLTQPSFTGCDKRADKAVSADDYSIVSIVSIYLAVFWKAEVDITDFAQRLGQKVIQR
jgi:hypothetical protein